MSEPLARLALTEKVLQRLQGRGLSERLCQDSLGKPVGAGAYSTVFCGSLKDPEEVVAVKCLRFYCDEEKMKRLFEQEIYVWEKFEHDNIARLLGFAFNNENDPLLISPWMENGSAWHFVTKPENKDIDVYPLVLGIARGLHYLHVEKLSIHSDLKAANVLVSSLDPLDAVIGDFGTARIFNASLTLGRPNSEIKGTARWIAIELFRNAVRRSGRKRSSERLDYSTASDVWAFGMTVYELLARQIPYHTYLIDEQVVIAVMEHKLPEFDTGVDGPSGQLLKNICGECWNPYPGERTTMCDVLTMLEGNTTEHVYDTSMRDGQEGTITTLLLSSNRVISSNNGIYPPFVFLRTASMYIAIGAGHMVYVYETITGAIECVLEHGPGPNSIRDLCFSHTSSILATSASDGNVRIWDTSEEEECETFSMTDKGTSSLAYEPVAGKYLVCVLDDGSVCMRNNSSRRVFEIQNEGATSATFSPDGRTVATGSVDGLVRIYNSKDRCLLRSLAELPGCVDSLMFSPSGSRIVGCGGNMIKSWHVSEEKIHTIDFIGHRDVVRGLAVDRDGDARWVLSTGHAEDGAVNIWALCNGVFVGELSKVVNTAYHNGPVISIDFCNKIRIFATAARDEVRLWTYDD